MKRPDPHGPVELCRDLSPAIVMQVEQTLKSRDIKVYVLQSARASANMVAITPIILVRREDRRRARAIVKAAFREAARLLPPQDPQPQRVLPFDWYGWLTIALVASVIIAGLLFDPWPWTAALPVTVYVARLVAACVQRSREKNFMWS